MKISSFTLHKIFLFFSKRNLIFLGSVRNFACHFFFGILIGQEISSIRENFQNFMPDQELFRRTLDCFNFQIIFLTALYRKKLEYFFLEIKSISQIKKSGKHKFDEFENIFPSETF